MSRERAEVRFMPSYSGDGYGYGGGAVLCIGRHAIPFGEIPSACKLAEDIAEVWNAACSPTTDESGFPTSKAGMDQFIAESTGGDDA